ncbi:MAG TPA: ATP-binding protein [Solirubrobacteraceae bacterium]|jgi:signal transduction histidine kinase/ActR/RegA family two-component response regulator|nr:ATP-binding protein [Solirubrobacteraceae bacterium]
MGASERGTAHLFVKHALIVLIPVVALGVALGLTLSNEARHRGLVQGTDEARLVAQTAVEPLLDKGPVRAPINHDEQERLSRLVRSAVQQGDILRLRVRNLQGFVVFSDDGSGKKQVPEDEAIDAAHGETVARLTRLNDDSNDVGDAGPAAVEVYQPLLQGQNQRRIGVLELYLPYAPIARDVAASLNRLYISLAVGLALLYAALLVITLSVSRGLRRQLALNAAANAELVVARDEAVEASNMKSAFLANISHELRTPMNGVLGMNELLLDTELDENQADYAHQIARSGEHMMSIVNDVLDIARIEAGQLVLDEHDFELHEAIVSACAAVRDAATAKELAFEVRISDDVPHCVHGDGGRLNQIVANLADNAVKFTAQGSVDVGVAAMQAEDGALRLRVEVADTGIGVDPEALERIFELFAQADNSSTRSYGGTGLGLAIARELVALMDGEIGVESQPGSGSTFWFEVDLAAASGVETPRVAAVQLASSAPHVLIAEDSPVNRIVASRAVERCGCHTTVVADGREALVALEREHFDAVLMDCHMPELDGYTATRALRKREGDGPRTPVVAMTTSAARTDVERCLAAGMDDYVSKPMRHQTLQQTLRRWVPALTGAAAAPVGDRVHSLHG